MKIATILGARPQFIKASMVSRELANHGNIKELIIHTGQHFDDNMSKVFFNDMEIPPPDYELNIHSLSHGAMTGRMIEGIENILIKENPNWVLVYGDTNSTLAGSLAAAKLNIQIAHVESGLRSFNMQMPEEINRILSDHIATLLFCPTENSIENLKNEGFSVESDSIISCGDIMYDSAQHFKELANITSTILSDYELTEKEYVLCSIHRPENTDNPKRLSSIIEALNEINLDSRIILPLHPRTKKYLKKYEIESKFDYLEPVSYFDNLVLLNNCQLVITDSGGLQKEAFFFNKYCITLRNETEWVELIENGCSTLAGANKNKIINSFKDMIGKSPDFEIELYGKGEARKQIVQGLLSYKV